MIRQMYFLDQGWCASTLRKAERDVLDCLFDELDLTVLLDGLSFLTLGLLIGWSILESHFNLSRTSNC